MQNGAVKGIPVFEDVKLTYPALIEVAIILAAAFYPLNHKCRDPPQEPFYLGCHQRSSSAVYWYFYYHAAGPYDLKGKGCRDWYHRAFSNVLGNRFFVKLSGQYTYLSGIPYDSRFSGIYRGMQTILGTVPVAMLEAISCGAVFMGANTYIGNAPNFMVKAISDENGIKMPSFLSAI